MNRFLSLVLSSVLILLSPGFAPYQALAADIVEPGIARPISIETPVKSMGVAPIIDVRIQDVGTIPSLEVSPLSQQSLSANALGATAQTAAAAQTTASGSLPSLTASAETLPARAKAIRTLSADVNATLNNAGPIARSESGAAYETGNKLQSALSGERLFESPGSPTASAPENGSRVQAPMDASRAYLARPAGQEISDSAKALFSGGPNAPVPPGGGNNNGGGGNGGSGGERIPLAPRILTSLVAAAPILLAWPLIAGGSLLTGGLLAAASLGVAAMPWMGPATSKTVRSIPGFFIAGLGLATLAVGIPAAAGATITAGALASLGGWGMIRFARDPNKWKNQTSSELISTFFGSFAAVGGAALVLAHPAGLAFVGLRYLAIPFAFPLLAQLPGWIGETVSSPLQGAYLTIRDNARVFGAIHRDTVWFKRLSAYTEAAVKKPWNVVWLGLVVWLPVLTIEAAWQTIGFAWGLALSAARAIPMALWGLSHGLSSDSKASRFFGAWAETMFAVSKVRAFNRAETKLIPWANGQSKLQSVAAAVGIRALQLLWIPASAVLTLGAAVVAGPIAAFRALKQPAPQGGKSPDSLSLERDPLSENVPSVEKPRTVASTPGKLLATAIALVPAVLFGAPLVFGGAGLFAPLIAVMFLSIAAMPLMPESSKVPGWLRTLPASTLKIGGFFAAVGAARFVMSGLPVGPILALGVLAFGAGVGLARLIGKLQDGKTSSWQLESPEYIGGFVSALGVATAFSISLLGSGGSLYTGLMIGGGISSVFLLAFLPPAFWKGVGGALVGLPAAIKGVHKTLGFWGENDSFRDSLSAWYRHYTSKSGWYAIYFIAPWGAAAVLMLAEAVASAAIGLVFGAARVPANFAWSASYGAEQPGRFKLWGPDGKATRFFSGFARAWRSYSEGEVSRRVFDGLVGRLKPAMAERAATGRPTLKALGAFIASRFAQAAWLVYAALSVALGWIPALVAGVRNASGAKTKGPQGQDPDRPSDRIGIFGL